MSLYPTPTRKALLRAVKDGKGRIYCEGGVVYDGLRAVKVTAAFRPLLAASWIRVRTDEDPVLPGEWSKTRIYYRITDMGEHHIAERGKR